MKKCGLGNNLNKLNNELNESLALGSATVPT